MESLKNDHREETDHRPDSHLHHLRLWLSLYLRPATPYRNHRQCRQGENSIVCRDKFPVGQAVGLLYDPNNPSHFHLDRGDMEERSTRGTIIFALVWLTIAVATIAVLLSVNPELRIQLKRLLYNAIAPLRSVINPSEN